MSGCDGQRATAETVLYSTTNTQLELLLGELLREEGMLPCVRTSQSSAQVKGEGRLRMNSGSERSILT